MFAASAPQLKNGIPLDEIVSRIANDPSRCPDHVPQPRCTLLITWGADSFEEFIEHNPDLLDRKLIERFYSRELLLSEPARAAWVSPDLRALPALV